MKMLIAGCEGQLGWAMARQAVQLGIEVKGYNRAQLDITRQDMVNAIVSTERPDVIVNCAAYNVVERADEDVESAYRVNAFGPWFLALAAKDIGAQLVHISTDYVFDGVVGEYVEESVPNPINVYGASKHAGEELIAFVCKEWYIIRTSWLFGPSARAVEKNFVTTIVHGLQKGQPIRVVSDQWGCPTYSIDLAEAICQLLAMSAPYGVYHVTNSGVASRYQQAQEIARCVGAPLEHVVPISTAESITSIRRPRKTVLLNARWRLLGLSQLRPWQEALGSYMELKQGVSQ